MDFPERLTAKGFFTRIGILLLVAAVLLVAALIFYYRPVGYTERICSIRYLYDQATQKTRLIVNGEVKKDVQGPLRKNSSDGRGYTEAAVFESGEMLVVRGEKVLQVISGVVDAEICATGKTIAYLTDEGGLYRLDVGKDSTPKLISKNVAQEPFCISPDGNEVLYVTRTSEVSKMAIDSADGKAPYFQNLAGYRPIAVANECAYLYYIRESDNTLYIYEKKNETAIECGSFLPGSLVFNRDFDQVMFTTENGCRFFEEGKELHFEAFSANERFELLINQRVNQKTAINGVQYLQKTLLQSYCAIKAENPSDPTENAVQLAYLKQNKGVVRVERGGYMDSTEKAVVTDKYVFFISTDVAQNDKHSNLFAAKAGQIEAQRLMADVEEFCPNIDGSRVLYRATQGPLRSMRVGSAPMHLADEVVPGSICVTLDDTFYYRTPDGALYRSSNGAAPEQVMPNVLVAYADAHVAFFATDKGDGVMDVYANYRNRRKSELVFEGYSG